eukprot:1113018-Prymnesium_polylepis.2
MRQDLARKRKEDEDLASALEADALMRRQLIEDARTASIAAANELGTIPDALARLEDLGQVSEDEASEENDEFYVESDEGEEEWPEEEDWPEEDWPDSTVC